MTGRLIAAVLVLAAIAAAAVWWVVSRPPPPDEAAAAFAAAWDDGDPGAGPVAAPSETSAGWQAVREGLGGADLTVALRTVEQDEEDDARADATLGLTWALPGDRVWAYEVSAPMDRGDEGWRVRWSAEVAHPRLADGEVLTLRRTTPPRADVVAEDGTPIVTARPVVDVGVQPSRVDGLDATVTSLRGVLDLDLDGLEERIEDADPDRFVRVVTLREPEYEDLRDQLQPIPGAVFQRGEQQLAPTREFARATLGRAGPVTAELIEEDPDRYAAGDVAGLSGLQRTYDEQLGGRPGLEVLAVPADGEADGEELFSVDPEPGAPVTVSLDPDVQTAADAALAGQEEFPTAIVAIRISDGHVLAVANGPASGGLDLALTGRYPPGSTFKIVTTAALLQTGLEVDDPITCPATTTVDGRDFRNAEDQALGEVPFRTAFASSCNTAFVELSRDLPPSALRDAASAFGLGSGPELGVVATGAEVPATEGGTDLAASAIGQGQVLVSPFAVAELAAAAARGAALPPSLVLEEDAAPTSTPLPDAVADELPGLMRAVVTEGSATVLADVPGEPVHAKTGSAEYGDQTPPRTHAWVTGWQGDVAFAVLVAETEDAFGGRAAAPIAADLLIRLADR
ncbi:MAG: penicillin-binding transpeptidase domain-containing protein [Nitriliruptor sp.]